jgi:hypothetical protein
MPHKSSASIWSFQTENYRFGYDINAEGFYFVHCEVFKWSKSIRHNIIENWALFLKTLPCKFSYSLIKISDVKNNKFHVMLNAAVISSKYGFNLYVIRH